jgi:hypothetical protein
MTFLDTPLQQGDFYVGGLVPFLKTLPPRPFGALY